MSMLLPRHMLFLRYILFYLGCTSLGILWVDQSKRIVSLKQKQAAPPFTTENPTNHCSDRLYNPWIKPNSSCDFHISEWSIDPAQCSQHWVFDTQYQCMVRWLNQKPQSFHVTSIQTEKIKPSNIIKVTIDLE